MKEKVQESSCASKAAVWEARIRAWELSGLSQVAFCRQHDFKLPTFLYWRQKFPASRKSTRGLRLVPLQDGVLRDEGPRPCDRATPRGITLMVSGVHISVGDDFDEVTLVRVIQAMKGV